MGCTLMPKYVDGKSLRYEDFDVKQVTEIYKNNSFDITPNEFLDTIFPLDLFEDQEYICISRPFHFVDDSGQDVEGWSNREWPPLSKEKKINQWFNDKTNRQDKRYNGLDGAWHVLPATVNGEYNDKKLLRKEQNTLRVFAVFFDDICRDYDYYNLPGKLLESWALETSPGNIQLGWLIEPTDDIALYKGFITLVAEKLKGSDPGATRKIQVLRLPDSAHRNHEKYPGWRAVLRYWQPDNVYTLLELIEDFGLKESECRSRGESLGKSKGLSTKVAKHNGKKSYGSLTKWMLERQPGQAGYVHNVNDDGSMEIICPNYLEHTANIFGGTIYYPPGVGDGAMYYRHKFKCQHGHCEALTDQDFIDLLVDEGAPYTKAFAPHDALNSEYIIVNQSSGTRIVDVDIYRRYPSKAIKNLESFKNTRVGRMELEEGDTGTPPTIANSWLSSHNNIKTDGFMYAPEEPDNLIISKNRKLFLNEYVRPHHCQSFETETPKTFISHLENLVGKAVSVRILKWLAFKLQNPDKRCFALWLISEDGKQGTGRSWLGSVVDDCFRETANLSLPELLGLTRSSTYNEWESKSQIVFVQESQNFEFEDRKGLAYETFKERVDTRPSKVQVNTKFGAKEESKRYYNVIGFSNESCPFKIHKNDRRIEAYVNRNINVDFRNKKEKFEYFSKLEEALDNGEGSRLYWYLKELDVSDFNHVDAEVTDAKLYWSEESLSPMDQLVDWVYDNSTIDLFTRNTLYKYMLKAYEEIFDEDALDNSKLIAVAVKKVWAAMRPLNPLDKHSGRFTLKGKQYRVRALFDRERYLEISMIDKKEFKRLLEKDLAV